MKKLHSIFAVLIFVLAACSGSNSKQLSEVPKAVSSDSTIVTPTARVEEGKATFRNSFDPENVMDWSINYAFYSCDECELLPYQKQVNRQITAFFDENKAKDVTDKTFFDDLLKDFNKQQKEMNADSEYPMAFEMNAEVSIEEGADRVQLAIQQYLFLAGAHGQDIVLFYQFDKETGKQLKLSDFIMSKTKLNKIAEKYFRRQNDIPMEGTLMDHGFDAEFSCNDNFFFKDGKLCFYFNQYEIACYAMGAFEFGIPLKDLGGLLTRKP
jgi:hypothetical protein